MLPTATLLLGAVTAVLCVALFICTGMIYACLRLLQEWATPLTPINYLLLGCASGATLAAACAAVMGSPLTGAFVRAAIALTVAGAIMRVAALVRNRRLRPRIDTAVGDRHPAPPHPADRAGDDGRLVQHPRVLPRRDAAEDDGDQVGIPAGRVRVADRPARAGPRGTPRRWSPHSSCSTQACWPNAGTSSPTRTTRRTSTTRRSRNALAPPAGRGPDACRCRRDGRARRLRRRRGRGRRPGLVGVAAVALRRLLRAGHRRRAGRRGRRRAVRADRQRVLPLPPRFRPRRGAPGGAGQRARRRTQPAAQRARRPAPRAAAGAARVGEFDRRRDDGAGAPGERRADRARDHDPRRSSR